MSGRARWLAALALVAGLCVLGWIAHALLWSTYMVYDDEGYVQYSLRAYAEHGHLYSDVYSQYGPFFFVLGGLVQKLGFVFTNVGGREATLACWLGAAWFCALIVWRGTGCNIVATAAALVAAFVHLHVMTDEPTHPGGFIALLVAAAAWCGARYDRARLANAAAIGAIGAMIALTKINVGALLFIGAGSWWLLRRPYTGSAAWRGGLAAGFTITVIGLTWSLHDETWVRIFAVVAVAGYGAVVASLPAATEDTGSSREVWAAGIGAALVIAVTVAAMLTNGTSWGDILKGTVLGPLHHPSVYHLALHWRTGTLPLAMLSLAGALAFRQLPDAWRLPFVATTRILTLLGYVAAIGMLLPISVAAWVTCYGLVTAWVFVVPWRKQDPMVAMRSWLALLLITQSLHGYPVAGSQLSWGTFLWIPLAIVGLVDLAPLFTTAIVRRLFATAGVAFIAVLTMQLAVVARDRVRTSDPLRLPGAETLLLPEKYATELRTVARNAEVHADVLFSLPGMMSFNAWTGVPPPTIANTTHWFNLLSAQQQLAIRARLEQAPRSVVVVQRYVYDLLRAERFIHGSPLLDWIESNYRAAFRLGTYELWVRTGRKIAPIDVATLYTAATGELAKFRISVDAAIPRDVTIKAVELRRFTGDGSAVLQTWNERNAVVRIAHLAPAEARGKAIAADRVQLDVFTNRYPAALDRQNAVIYLLDATGARVGEARFVE